jgi:hypothetical protein
VIALANEGVRNENTLLCGGDCRRPSNFCHWLCAEWIAGSDLNFHLFSFATINIENLRAVAQIALLRWMVYCV